jgi:heat shock protein 5
LFPAWNLELTRSVQRGGKVEIIANDQGNRITPSWVAFTDEERLIGDAAKNQAPQNPENTVFDAKRMIGRTYDDKDVQRDLKHFPFKIVNKGGKPMISVNNRGELKDFVSAKTADSRRALMARPPRRSRPWFSPR